MTAAEGVRLLSSLPGGEAFPASVNNEAVDINDAGQILGHLYETGNARGFVRNPDGTVRFLPMPPGAVGVGPLVWGMNEGGDVVGRVNFGEARYHAFLWPAVGGYRDLGDLPGGLDLGTAVPINGRGDIAGDAMVEPDSGVPNSAGQRAVRYLSDGRIVELGVPPGMSDSGVFDMNDLGDVVGRGRLGAFDGLVAILWTSQGEMLDLNDYLDESSRGWTLLSANAINNFGQIVVSGRVDGRYTSALLTPVPESAGLVAAAGLPALLRRRRRAPTPRRS